MTSFWLPTTCLTMLRSLMRSCEAFVYAWVCAIGAKVRPKGRGKWSCVPTCCAIGWKSVVRQPFSRFMALRGRRSPGATGLESERRAAAAPPRRGGESFSKIALASPSEFPYSTSSHGGVAQLGERLTGSQEVRGSIPLVSTRALNEAPTQVGAFFHIGTQGQRRHHDPPGRQDRKKLRRTRPL